MIFLFLVLPAVFLIGCLILTWVYFGKLRSSGKRFTFHISDMLYATVCLMPTIAYASWLVRKTPNGKLWIDYFVLLIFLTLAQLAALFVARVQLIAFYDEITFPWKSGCCYLFFTAVGVLSAAIAGFSLLAIDNFSFY